LRDLCKTGAIELKFCCSEDQLADIFAKPLKCFQFQNLRRSMGIGAMEEFKADCKLKLDNFQFKGGIVGT